MTDIADISEQYDIQVTDALLNMFSLLQNELNIPPMYSCLLVCGHCLVSLKAAYERKDLEPPEELLHFLNDTLVKIQEDQDDFISEQYLTLNTSGYA